MFTRSGFQLREGKPFKHRDEVWRTLEVTFPDNVPTHSREQTFYFNERGILQRLDYVAEVVGNYAVSAHSVYDHKTFDGIVVQRGGVSAQLLKSAMRMRRRPGMGSQALRSPR